MSSKTSTSERGGVRRKVLRATVEKGDLRRASLAGIAILVLASPLGLVSATAQVSRAQAIQIAESYLRFEWKPTAENSYHAKDKDGVLVDTPDVGFRREGIRPGWWIAGAVNTGMPYQWGGFSSLDDFRAALRRGAYAGDVYTSEKRRLGDSAVSKQAVGIDCSGLISRCWRLPRAYSTLELPTLCEPLPGYEFLKPGDILNVSGAHVLLFKGWGNRRKERILAYEAGSPPSWKVLLNDMPVSLLREKGYRAFRYKGIRE